MGWLSFTFGVSSEEQKEILIAELSSNGFDGFEEDDLALKAFIEEKRFSDEEFDSLISVLCENFPVEYIRGNVPDENWNEAWEKNFPPVMIDDRIAIRASFHPAFSEVEFEIIIDPKMAFGTGHHETTSMMMRLMLKKNFTNKTVLDFGSGTGILSILASKLGAASGVAVDNDNNACENAEENFLLNGVENVSTVEGDASYLFEKNFDFILANITREVIINNKNHFASCLASNGKLLISGFLGEDEAVIRKTFETEFIFSSMLADGNWIAMTLALR